MKTKRILLPEERQELLATLKIRFEKNRSFHKNINWIKVEEKLNANPEKLWSLHEMEKTGGEPDVVRFDEKTGNYVFYDFSTEVPKAGEIFLMIGRDRNREKRQNRTVMLWIWPQPWVLKF